MRHEQIGDSLLWRHVRVNDNHYRVGTDSGFQPGGCNVVRSFVQERKFVARFTAVVSSNYLLIACGLERGLRCG